MAKALGRVLQGFITILIGVNLAPSVANGVSAAQHYENASGSWLPNPNMTGTNSTIIGLTTLFFVLGIMSAGVQLAVGGMADIGLI